LKHAQTCLYYN